uniref:ribonuclease T2 n=1 Tax=Sphaerocreas pubescens TaxID=1237932 RepID=A0A0M5MU05_9FUNG|nr:ribonuclease T2 [Sphaerocreas pubescens]
MLFIVSVAAALVGTAAATAIDYRHSSFSCPIHAVSCVNYTVPVNSCCTELKGGLMMITELWQSGTPQNGPDDKWTIHGLWSDYCVGGDWPQFCEPDRMLNNTVVDVLTQAGEHQLLKDMDKYWLGSNGTASNAPFWEHEWNKHGTCMTTLEPSCLPSSKHTNHTDAVTFYKTVVGLYKRFDFYKALKAHNIVPSDKPYKTQDVSDAIESYFGNIPNIQCFDGAISAIWIYFHVEGNVATGNYVPTIPDSPGNCNDTLLYPVKVIGPGF